MYPDIPENTKFYLIHSNSSNVHITSVRWFWLYFHHSQNLVTPYCQHCYQAKIVSLSRIFLITF